jgi:hypothetical protein
VTGTFESGVNYFYTKNSRFFSLLDGAVQVGRELATSAEERSWVERLEHSTKSDFWPGYQLHLDQYFADIEAMKFWGRVFDELAWRVFERRFGNQSDTTWRVSFIAEAQLISQFLIQAVRKVDRTWSPSMRTPPQDGTLPLRIKMAF